MSDNKQGLNPPLTSGWPVCYDITIDQYRLVQQADVDKWMRMEQSYGRIVTMVRRQLDDLNSELARTRSAPTVDPNIQSTATLCDIPSCIDSEP